MSTRAETFNRTAVFWAACVGIALFGVSMIIVGAILPKMPFESAEERAMVVALLPLGILAGSLVFGPVCDRFGYKGLFITACLCVIAGMYAIAWVENPSILKGFIALMGFGGGVLNGQTNAVVSDIYDDKLRASRLSLMGAFYGVGALSITLFVGLLGETANYSVVITGIAAVFTLLAVWTMTVRFPAPAASQSFPVSKAVKLLASPVLLLLSLILFFESGVEGAANSWTTSYLTNHTAIPGALVVQTLTFMLIAITLSRFALGYLLSRFRPGSVLLCCFACACAGFGLLWWVGADSLGFAGAAAAMVLVGIGVSATYPVILGIIGRQFAALVGTAFGVAMTISLLGNTLINYSIGRITPDLSLYPPIAIGCVAAMAALFLIHLATSKKK